MTMVLTGHPVVDAISQMNFEGDITPKSWYQHIKYANKRGVYPDLLAIALLADIVYWYRATEVRDEKTGHLTGWKRKFKYDYLQRSPEHFSRLFGFSVKQVRESLKLLSDLNLIEIILKPVKTQFGVIPNVMHISLNPAQIANITYRITPEILEKSLLPNSVTSSAEIGNKQCRNRQDSLPKSVTSSAEIGKLSLYKDLTETKQLFHTELEPPHPVPNLPHPEQEREDCSTEDLTPSKGESSQISSAMQEEKKAKGESPQTTLPLVDKKEDLSCIATNPVQGINSAAAFLSSENNQPQPEPVPTTDKPVKLSRCRNFDEVRDYLEAYPGEEFGGAIANELSMLNLLPWKGHKRVSIFGKYNRNFVHYIAQGWTKEAPESRYADVVARLVKAERNKAVFITICSQWELFDIQVNSNERKLKAIEKRLDKHLPQQPTQPAVEPQQTPLEQTQNKSPLIADDMTSDLAIREACRLILEHGEEEFASWHDWNRRWLRTFRTSPQVKAIYSSIKQQHEQQELGVA